MNNAETNQRFSIKSKQIIHITLQLLALAFLLGWCFNILAPFFNPIIWASILAVSLYPMHQRLKRKLKGRGVLAAVILTIVIFGLLLFVGSWLGMKTGSEIKTEIVAYQEGRLKIPPPPASVKEWPVIGKKSFQIWSQLTDGVETFLLKYPEEVRSFSSKLLSLLTSTGKAPVNSMIDIVSTSREAARVAVVPRMIFVVLCVLIIVSGFLSGYGSKNLERNKVLVMAFAIITRLALYLVVDPDKPRQGFVNLNTSEQLLVDLRSNFN